MLAVGLISCALLLGPSDTDACQLPPENTECQLLPDAPFVKPNEPFKVWFTLTNFPTAAPFPPPYLDDLPFSGSITSTQGMPPGSDCSDLGDAGLASTDPTSVTFELDEAWSPHADEPTSHTEEVVVTPFEPGAYFGVEAQFCGGDPTRCERGCLRSLCVVATEDPRDLPHPTAQFLEPLQAGEAGGVLPFRLRVTRNAYPTGRPLTVRVLPENFSDPLDIFPLTPAGLSTTGVDVLADDEILDFQCQLHFPCFVGVDNVYHVTIHDGATLLWDSSVRLPTGMARAHVARAPIARQELVAIDDDGGDGRIATGERATVHVRLYGRNPSLAAAIDGPVLEASLPPELVVLDHELHHHDNPMDGYDPTPAELAATGSVTFTAGNIRVDADPIVARFTTPPFTPPAVFLDLFEIELYLETPPGGIASPGVLELAGLRVTGTSDGAPVDALSAPLMIDVHTAAPPHPVRPLHAVRRGGDVRLVFDDPPTDPAHGPATRFEIWRSLERPDAWSSEAVIDDSAAPTEEWIDVDAIAGPDDLHFYQVVAHNGDGHSGDQP